MENKLQEVFQSVSNGKQLLASVITDKGIETLATDSFTIMADNIGKISGSSETIPTVFEMGTLKANNHKNFTIDISKTYFVITGSNISNPIPTDKIAQFSIINSVVTKIIQPSKTYSDCLLSENTLIVKNIDSIGYTMDYIILEM